MEVSVIESSDRVAAGGIAILTLPPCQSLRI